MHNTFEEPWRYNEQERRMMEEIQESARERYIDTSEIETSREDIHRRQKELSELLDVTM
jgi:hypothetical protein